MIKQVLFTISGFVPLLFLISGDTTLLIYSLFVLIYFLRSKISPLIQSIPIPTPLLLFFLIFGLGIISEWLVWLSVHLSGNPDPEINPNLFLHLKSIYGFYVVKAISWTVILQFFRFSLLQVFITQSIFGIFIEQQGRVLLQALANPAGLIWLPYVALVYSSYVTAAFVLVEGKLNMLPKWDHWVKYPLIWLLIFLLLVLATLLFGG